MDPFAALGLEPRMDLTQEELEAVHLELSRHCHPDHHQGLSTEEQVSMLSRSAEVNDAYKLLKNPWTRAQALLEVVQPGILEAKKQLDAAFLMQAMEQAEELSKSTKEQRPALRSKLEALVDHCLREVTALIGQQKYEAAAVLLHQSRYHRKALADLEAMQE